MKQRALRFSHLVDLQSIPGLERITDNDDGLSIGGAGDAPVGGAFAAGAAAGAGAGPGVQSRGERAHPGDRVRGRQSGPRGLPAGPAAGAAGSRRGGGAGRRPRHSRGSVEGLLPRHVRDGAGAGQILVEVRVPHVAPAARTVYSRFSSLSANDWPCIGVAALLSLDGDDVGELRLGLSGVAEAPLLAAGLERFQGEPCSGNSGTRSAKP